MKRIQFYKSGPLSFIALIVALLFAAGIRFEYHTNHSKNGYNATTWDAFGYYAYLPATFIYKDNKKLEWIPRMDSIYQLSGGYVYQADTLENGNLTFKYLGGVAVMQSPFFGIGHIVAKVTSAPEDGFSWPYQYAIIWGAIFWFFIGILVLRKVLLYYFSDKVTAITLLLLVLGTNILQYVSVDGAMSHVYIFPLYAILLYLTHHWHLQPKNRTLFIIAFVIGLASICRPTELVMIFIPILWTWKLNIAQSKWTFIWQDKKRLILVVLGFTLGILPQLIYWKYTTGSWVHNVGSKWNFLNPWWRVLVGFEKGWFIYTPLTILFVIGFFFTKGKPFHKALLTFGLLNIWIVISWSDWRYGASYSTRALVQSYPVYAFAMAGVLSYLGAKKWNWSLGIIALYFCSLNLFQIWQYNRTILHYDHMNFSYYKSIYWNADPSPLDYSLLDSACVKPQNWKPLKALDFQAKDTVFPQWKGSFFNASVANLNGFHFKTSFTTSDPVYGFQWSFEEFTNGLLTHTYLLRLGQPNMNEKAQKKYEAYFKMKEQTDSISVSLINFQALRMKHLKMKVELEQEIRN